ncbi:amidohydrolase [Vibrio alfacsensis]|uniref:amidohydrolase n=1 Tax=Vibrio alfacsensis TaxID=1074311 RepID=UPI0040676C0E
MKSSSNTVNQTSKFKSTLSGVALAVGMTAQAIAGVGHIHEEPVMGEMIAEQVPIADIIYINGKIITLDDASTIAQAVAVQGGKVLATGDTDTIRELASESTKIIDLQGKTVMPGMVDSHAHASLLMKVRNEYVDIHFSVAPNIKAVQSQLAERAKETPKGEFIYAVGSGASAQYWEEKRIPTTAELDAVSTDHPIIVLVGMHVAVLNSTALEVLNIGPNEEYQHGSHIFLDENGLPTGVIGEPIGIFPDLIYDKETLELNITKRIPEWFLKWGVTSVTDIGVPYPNYKKYQEIAASGINSPVRMTYKVNYESTGKTLPSKDLSELAMPLEANADYWQLAGIKIWADGEGGANPATAYITGNYQDRPGDHGLINTTQHALNDAVGAVHKAGLGMFVHASGDKAQEMVLDATEYAQKWYGNTDAPVVLEHFGVIMGTEESFKRAVELDAKACIQPYWIETFPANTIAQLGKERAEAESFRFKDMIDFGLKPAFGSDQTGTQRGDDNTLKSIELMITRMTAEGTPFLPEQALSIDEALRVMTVWAAEAQNQGDVKGSLEAGKYADMVVLSDDIIKVAEQDASKISDIQVLETIVGGESVYQLND